MRGQTQERRLSKPAERTKQTPRAVLCPPLNGMVRASFAFGFEFPTYAFVVRENTNYLALSV